MASRYAKQTFLFTCMAVVALSLSSEANAQNNGFNNGFTGGFNRVVGGVMVDAEGVVRGEQTKLADTDLKKIREGLKVADADVAQDTSLRLISLRGLEAAVTKAFDAGEPLSADVQYMAGLQRLEYVILSPETNDIILAGPGEGWTTNDDGTVVGKKSGMPVLHLQDFMVAMRSVDAARQGSGVSVSIDPTKEGTQRVQAIYDRIARERITHVSVEMQREIEKASGQQTVSLTGVPRDSHFSRVLLTADYKMKRIAMGLDKSPIRQLPSMMSIIARKRVNLKRAMPRMWIECNYEPVAKSADNNIWKIAGSGVAVQTEDQIADALGQLKGTGKKLKVAEDWAKSMTKHYEKLSAEVPVFRDLRNVMDMSVIAAIVRNEHLLSKVGLELSMIGGKLPTPTYAVPESIPAQCSVADSYAVQVSGGVLVDSWGAAQNTVVDEKLTEVAAVAKVATADRWWWNAKQ